jgi:hypothetical protein
MRINRLFRRLARTLRIAWCLAAVGLLVLAGFIAGWRALHPGFHSVASKSLSAKAVVQTSAPAASAHGVAKRISPPTPTAMAHGTSEPALGTSQARQLARAAIDPSPTSRWEKLEKMGLKPSNDDFRAAMPASVWHWEEGTSSMQDIRGMLDVLGQWLAVDAAAGAAWIMQLPEVAWPECRPKNDALYRYVSDWTRLDARAVERWLGMIPPCRSRDMAISRFVQGLVDAGTVQADPQRAAFWCGQIRDPSFQSAPLAALATAWCRRDIQAGAAWINSLPPSAGKDLAVNQLTRDLASEYPAYAMTWALSVGDEEQRVNAVGVAMASWVKVDMTGASQFVVTMKDGRDRDEAIRVFAEQGAAIDAAGAMEWTEMISDMGARQHAMENVAGIWLGQDRAAAIQWLQRGLLPQRIVDQLVGPYGAP